MSKSPQRTSSEPADKPSPTSNGSIWQRPAATVFCAIVLVLVTFAIYAPAIRYDFVDYDDGTYVFGNAHVQAGFNWAGLRWALTSGEASNWHPLTWLSHMFDVTVFGKKAGGHHLTSIVVHSLNAALVLILLNQMTGRMWASSIVAALFALHPLHVESVAWISERKDVLSACFGLLSLMAYANYVESKAQSPRSKVFYCGSLTLFALGLMSKPMLVTLPFIMLLLDWWPLRRLAEGESRTSLRGLLVEKIPFLVLCAASSIVTFLVQRKGGAVSTALPIGARLANAVVSYSRYLRKTFWPDDLSVLYPHPGHWPTQLVAGSGALLVILTFVALLCRNRTNGGSVRFAASAFCQF